MLNRLLFLTTLFYCYITGTAIYRINSFTPGYPQSETQYLTTLATNASSGNSQTDPNTFIEVTEYPITFHIPATKTMPELTFELTGTSGPEKDIYYPQELIIKTNDSVLQEFHFNEKLTLTEKIIDVDTDGYRKVYKLIDNQLKLTETTESHMK